MFKLLYHCIYIEQPTLVFISMLFSRLCPLWTSCVIENNTNGNINLYSRSSTYTWRKFHVKIYLMQLLYVKNPTPELISTPELICCYTVPMHAKMCISMVANIGSICYRIQRQLKHVSWLFILSFLTNCTP